MTSTLSPAWRRCIGTGRAALSLRSDHRDALERAQAEIGFDHIRGHGLLSDAMGVVRAAEHEGRRFLHHSFTYVDQVIDGYLAAGIRPFLELGFMPEELASGSDTVFWWKGNITPPRSYEEWSRLVSALLRHLIDRHGIDEVRTWPIEVWNEPNLTVFWKDADQAEYFRLYEATARTVKDVDDRLQVGGPAISPGADDWWVPFAEFVEGREVPVDFLAFHAYTSGPAQNVPFGTYQTLRHPHDLLRQFGAPAQLLAGSPLAARPKHVTEFNSSYRPDNPIHDTAYNAAYLAPVLANGGDLVDSFSYWTLSDVFEEAGVPTSLFHGGFGLLTHGLIPKPTYHLYAFMRRLGETILARGDDHLVTTDGTRISALLWVPLTGTGGDEPDRHRVHVSVPTAVPEWFMARSRVNEDEGNAHTAWRLMGRPPFPGHHQLRALHQAAEPARDFSRLPSVGGRLEIDVHLGRNEITLLELDPYTDHTPAWVDDSRLLGES